MAKKKWDSKPLVEREYIVTDHCYFVEIPREDYNPYDKKRSPHAIQLVDKETGTVVMLESGSVIKVVHNHDNPE